MPDCMGISCNYLADIVLVIHSSVVIFIVIGQLLVVIGGLKQWLWIRNGYFRLLHLLAISVVVLESWLGLACPLTTLENHLRQLVGQSYQQTSFIAHGLQYFLFYSAPEWVFIVLYTLFGSLVLITFLVYPPCIKTRFFISS